MKTHENLLYPSYILHIVSDLNSNYLSFWLSKQLTKIKTFKRKFLNGITYDVVYHLSNEPTGGDLDLHITTFFLQFESTSTNLLLSSNTAGQ